MKIVGITVLSLCLVLLWSMSCPAGEAYSKQDTWFDTLVHYKQALHAEAGKGDKPVALPDFGKGGFTFSAWLKTKRDGSLMAKTKVDGPWARGGKALFVRGGKMNYDIGWVGCVRGRTEVTDGQWHHVVLVGGAPQRIYVDGELDARGRLEAGADAPDAVLKLGHTSTSFPHGGFGFLGAIDDVRLYDRVLSKEDINELAAGKDINLGLLAWWPFDGTVEDASGGRNHPVVVRSVAYADGKIGRAVELKKAAHMVIACEQDLRMQALWTRLAADFPGATSLQEMKWERKDGIWGTTAAALDYPDIARRYAEAIVRPSSLAQRAAKLAGTVKDPDGLARLRKMYIDARRYDLTLQRVEKFDLKGLRETITDLYADGPRRDAFLSRLDVLEATAAGWADEAVEPDELDEWQRGLKKLRREAIVKHNPLMDFDEIVYVKRYTYSSNHYYTEYINSKWTPGGGLFVRNLKTGTERRIATELKDGVFGRFDVSFDAEKVVFGWKCASQKGYRIYEVNIDGSGLRQLTFPQDNEEWLVENYRARPHYHHGTDDMHPCYLPDGGIAFISTRCQYGILCDPPDDFTTTVLYRMDSDGKNMQQLSNSSVSEASPVVMPDGRILYTRWEYFDKGAVSVKCLWAMHPDGSASSEIYANDIALPPTFIYARAIPGATNCYVMCGTPHCPQNGVGTIIRLDMSSGSIRTREPMTYLTPSVDIKAEGGFAFKDDNGNWRQDYSGKGPLFKDPYPLSKRYSLVSHKPAGSKWHDPKGYGLYLLDETGNVSLVYRDPNISCWQPYPLKARPVPPVLKSGRETELAEQNMARCVVADVYHGLEGVERGEIKYIRVLEQIPRPWASRRRWGGDAYDQQHVCITKDTHLGLKVQHGVVPVEEDGSAHFLVPAGGNVSLQVLDANYMCVQTERTYVNYMPGETRSCLSCHETPDEAAVSARGRKLLAMRRPASVPGPQPGEKSGQRPLHYITDVQPVFNRHCVECHSGDEPEADLDLSGELTALFCKSYESLVPERRRRPRHNRRLLGPVIGENHPKTGNVHYLPARSLGSHASVLVAMLSKGKVELKDPKSAARAEHLAKEHKDIKLKPEELLRITNWVDTNAQYYGSYWGRRNLRYKDHPNFRPVPDFDTAISMKSPIPEEKR